MQKSVGIIGFGSFGQFMARELKPYFEVSVYDVVEKEQVASDMGVRWSSLAEVCDKEIVVVGVPLEFLESVLVEVAPMLKPGTLVLDVTSVKMKPAELMLRHLPENVEIIATHPLFGPKSGKNGIEGLNLALCDVRSSCFEEVCDFCREELKLNVIETTPEQHDKEAGYVMGLTHFIGQALNLLEIPECQQTTKSFEHLMQLKDLLSLDSMDLFYTIERDNPFAEQARSEFMQTLERLEDGI